MYTLNFKRKHFHPVDLKVYKIELFALKRLELPRKKQHLFRAYLHRVAVQIEGIHDESSIGCGQA